MPPKTAQSSGSQRKSDNELFSDASSSYWPKGWGWERYSDPDADFTTLSEDERAKMLNGLQQVLGDDGMRSLSVFMRNKTRELKDKRLNEQGVPPPEYKAPDFLKRQQKTHPDGP